MADYNLKQDLVFHEIYDKIVHQISGFGYAIKPSPGFNTIDFGNGVKLYLKLRGEKIEFSWEKPDNGEPLSRRHIPLYRNPITKGFAGYAIGIGIYLILSYLAGEMHITWNIVRGFLTAFWPLSLLGAGILYLLLFLQPLGAVSQSVHRANIQRILHEVILAYRAEEK
jgi:hypothetical protein